MTDYSPRGEPRCPTCGYNMDTILCECDPIPMRLIDLRQGSGGTNGHRIGHKLASIVGKDNMTPTTGHNRGSMCFIITSVMTDAEILGRWPEDWPTPVIMALH